MLFMCDQLLGAVTHLNLFYSDINLFFIGDASWKLCNIWFLFCENNSRSITILLEFNINAVPHPSSSCQLRNHKVRVYSIFASVFNLMKDTPVQLLAQISNTLDKKYLIQMKYSDFWMVWWKFTRFFMSYLKLQVCCSNYFQVSFRIQSKCKNSDFRFHQTFTLIGSFRWKYKTF